VRSYGGPGLRRAVATLLGARQAINKKHKARLCVRFSRRGNFPLVVRAKGYPKGEAQISVTATPQRRLGSPGPLQLNGSHWSATIDYSDAGSMTLQSSQMDKFGHWDSLPETVSDGTPATISMYSNHIAYGPEGSANYTTPTGSWQLQLGNPYSGPTYAGCAFAGPPSSGPEFCSVEGQLVNDGNGIYTVAQTITVGENPPTVAVGQQCSASLSEGASFDCTAAGQISPVNTDVSKIISGWEYTNQTTFQNIGAKDLRVGVPAATHGYIWESIGPTETVAIGAGASGHVLLEYDGPPGTSGSVAVQVVNVQIQET
jgi:hypothetical protein